jgi:hypothetical protein
LIAKVALVFKREPGSRALNSRKVEYSYPFTTKTC